MHPLHRYAAAAPVPETDYDEAQQFVDPDQEPDLSRYDDALYGGSIRARDDQHDQAYADDATPTRKSYDEGEEEAPKRRGGMVTVVCRARAGGVWRRRGLCLSHLYGIGPQRRAADHQGRRRSDQDRSGPDGCRGQGAGSHATGDGTEKIVPREEAPVDVNARSGPRVVFPALNQNGNPPSTASAAPSAPLPANPTNGTLPNNEPRRIRTFSVRGDPADPAANPVAPAANPATGAKPAATARTPATRTASAGNPSAANANAPLSLAPQGQPAAAEPPTRMAATNPTQVAPSAGGAGGGYLVQVSSQRSEADAQASYRALQGKFPAVLGSHTPLIKRADLGEKGVYYRAMVGPFGSSDEASQFCGNLKSAGGQCVVQRN